MTENNKDKKIKSPKKSPTKVTRANQEQAKQKQVISKQVKKKQVKQVQSEQEQSEKILPKQEQIIEAQEKKSLFNKIFSRKEKQGDEPIGFQKERHRAELYLKDKTKLKGLNAAVAEKMENTKNQIREGIDDLYTLLRLVAAYAQGEYRDVSKSTMVAVVAALLYFMSPIDLVPDMFTFIGLVDDLSVLAYVMRTFKKEIERFVIWEMTGGDVMDEGDVSDEGKKEEGQ